MHLKITLESLEKELEQTRNENIESKKIIIKNKSNNVKNAILINRK